MPWFEIVYSEDATGRALKSDRLRARNRVEAAEVAVKGLAKAETAHGAKCYRVLDELGLVVSRGPRSA